MKNYRQQMSPLIAESFGLSKDNQEILKSGDEKYQGFVVKNLTYLMQRKFYRIHVLIEQTNTCYNLNLKFQFLNANCI